jgi:hypothetical protein
MGRQQLGQLRPGLDVPSQAAFHASLIASGRIAFLSTVVLMAMPLQRGHIHAAPWHVAWRSSDPVQFGH